MADFITEAVVHTALATVTITQASLHTGNPGTDGTANELATAGYARQNASFNAAASRQRTLGADVSFVTVPGSTITHVAYWNGSTFIMSTDIPPITTTANGLIILDAATTFIGF